MTVFIARQLVLWYTLNMETIVLTKGYSALVDAEDASWLNQWKWRIHEMRGGEKRYACRSVRLGDKWATLFMHQVVAGTPAGFYTDHIDGDGLNNQRSNLRIVTRGQNIQNSMKKSVSSSKYKGVHFSRCSSPWMARIQKDGHPVYLGMYKTEVLAAEAYNKAALSMFGEYASLNQIEGNSGS